MPRTVPFLSFLPLLLLVPAAHAQVVDISGCRAVLDGEERFRCYEALGAIREPPAPEIARESNEESRITVENFGDRDVRQAILSEDERGETELHDTIAGLERILPNVWDITLSSGQVWRQVTSKRYNLREGDDVRIYPSRWGDDYRLDAERLEGFIQVRRLR